MFTRIITSSLLFLIAIGGFVVSYDTGSIQVSQSYADNWATDQSLNPSSAPATTAAGKEPDARSEGLNKAIAFINDLLGVITVIVSPAIIFASWLMSPDWTSGDLFGLRGPMHKMWIIVFNIVYFIYAILLIIIALATIFGKDNFSYKVMLPKLALGILMVPFTWWFVQWTISLSAIVTASVVSIPLEALAETKSGKQYLDMEVIPKGYFITSVEQTDKTTKSHNVSADCSGGGEFCTSVRKMLDTGGGMYSGLMMYAYDVFKLQEVKNISSTLDKIKTAGQLLNQMVVGAIMFFVFGLLVLALIAMLLLRAIKLWMYAIFSPVFTLHFVAGKELFGKSTEGFNLKEFIGLCFVPAVVGLTLSFGLMIVAVVRLPETPSNAGTCNAGTLTEIKYADWMKGNISGGCEIMTLFGNPNNKITQGIYSKGGTKYTITVVQAAGLTYVFHGKAKNNAEDMAANINTTRGGLDAAGGMFGTIIVNIIALIFIWMAFMAGKGVSKAVEAAVKPFEEIGNKVGTMAASLPKYTPLPIPGGSVAGASRAVDVASQIPSKMSEDRLKNSDLGRLLKMGDQASPADMEKMRGKLQDKTELEKIMRNGSSESKDMIKLAMSNSDKYGSEANLAKFAEEMKKKGGDKDIFNYLKDGGMDEKNAKVIAEEIAKGHTDPKSHPELAKAWKEVAKSGTTSGTAGSATGTTRANESGNGTVSINGATFNYNGIKDWGSHDDITKKISESIITKASTMTKPTIENLKKTLEDMGADPTNTIKIADKIFEKIKDTTFKN